MLKQRALTAVGCLDAAGFEVSFVEVISAKALSQDATQVAVTEKRMLLSRMLARLAHEIRNPLSSLDIHVQLLEEDLGRLAAGIGEKTAGRFEVIHGELRRLENIVKQFLRLAGPSDLELERVEVDKIIRHVCELLRPAALTGQIELQEHLAAELPVLLADPGQLTQAMLNLVINAIQAVEQNGKVEVRTRLVPPAGIAIEVHDSGPGVPSDKRNIIFDPYFTTKAEGTGLGLWIAQQIALAHGGDLEAGNSPLGGALFTFRLNVRPEDPARG